MGEAVRATRSALSTLILESRALPVFTELRILLFIDSCFWHGCKRHCRPPKTNRAYWQAKIDGNRRRDRATTKALSREGWRVLRIWEHELTDLNAVLDRVIQAFT
jgi:DNA mismatch endonuclease (patch repair protein)